ncbi:hypothetical protein [Sphingomonas solaris]|uniref:hypothetical protein n=1 Tax=Alterirhizorhabdus solaris TaxID=2529389 RepID=UPI001396A716|nr:hypothetical protein [Sphingomonas solaris]
MMMNALSTGMDDAVVQSLLRDAYVGSARVTPVEIEMLLARLDGWSETPARRKTTTR